jgi:hypothetical protein
VKITTNVPLTAVTLSVDVATFPLTAMIIIVALLILAINLLAVRLFPLTAMTTTLVQMKFVTLPLDAIIH